MKTKVDPCEKLLWAMYNSFHNGRGYKILFDSILTRTHVTNKLAHENIATRFCPGAESSPVGGISIRY